MPEPMDRVTDNLWIGSLAAALDADLLHKNGIKSVLSVMRGRIAIQKPFARYQVLLDDTDEADALVHFPACIEWIDSQIKKGRGVLVHCQAGMSRSATIVAAYIMYTQSIDTQAALDLIRKARPVIQPNDGFVTQLALFHSAHFKRTRRNKDTRAFYVERAVKEVLNGDGSALEMDMFAKFPRTPTDSVPNTPYPQPRRRLRCKMCRQELASREHMVDHGQVGPATPATSLGLSPAVSRRPSAGDDFRASRRGSTTADQAPAVRGQSGSAETSRRPSFGVALAPMTAITTTSGSTPMPSPSETLTLDRDRRLSASEAAPQRRKSLGANPFNGLSMTPMSNGDVLAGGNLVPEKRPRRRSLLGLGDGDVEHQQQAVDGLSMSAIESDEEEDDSAIDSQTTSAPLYSPRELATQIHPNLAALRSSSLISALSSSGSLGMTPLNVPNGEKQRTMSINSVSPPLLMPNTKCSGYFVEPIRWMGPFLESGNMAGKIVCPNKKCGSKLGNYDWAGVECSCHEWVVPGFCIHKSKVDEVVI
ncbi:hypothetical protein K439DRAFT_1412331 [Ramaria rubella]|nr:hypothetical protein K439DRAFT_1412331 [Ramaria rubella]